MDQREGSPFQTFRDDESFCQGDIVYRASEDNGGLGSFGVIITADCDIAQDKAGDDFSVLRIVTAGRYVKNVWAAGEVKRLAARQCQSVLPVLNSAIERADLGLSPLDPESLVEWLESRTPNEILDALDIGARSARSECLKGLECVREAMVREKRPPLDVLQTIWRQLGTNEKAIRGRLMEAFDPARGAADTYFVPYLPGFDHVGFVILLRAVQSLRQSDVYLNRTSARLAGRAGSYYRIGRFQDALRYSVVQRMVHLFSRIGLSQEYEGESSAAAITVVDEIHRDLGGAAK